MIRKKNILFVFVFIFLVCTGCQPVSIGQPGPGMQARDEIRPYALDLVAWEISNLASAAGKDDGSGPGTTEFSGLPENISEGLMAENITVFPQVRVRLVEPPLLLVVSPRDRIAYYDRALLIPGLPEDVMAEIEDKVDALDLSSLVVQLGGFGAAYPAVVSPAMTAEHVVNAAVEEWAHQHLAFKPLGFLYLVDSLGLRQDPDVIVMNETLAGMIAREVGGKVYERHYLADRSGSAAPDRAAFDFNGEMRATRLMADRLLAEGKTGEAERYMEDRRAYFNRQGYRIRKLNQAYFAFHGIYGQDPGAVSPVYRDMLELRKTCASLAGFVDKMSGMTTYADLEKAVKNLAD